MSKKKREHVTFDRMADPRRRIGRGGFAPPPRPGRPRGPPGPATGPSAPAETEREVPPGRRQEG